MKTCLVNNSHEMSSCFQRKNEKKKKLDKNMSQYPGDVTIMKYSLPEAPKEEQIMTK